LKTSPPVLVEASPRQLVKLPRPDPLSMREVKFEVYSKKNADELAARIKETPLITLTPRYYENLGLNFGEIVRYIKAVQAWGEANENLAVDEEDDDEATE